MLSAASMRLFVALDINDAIRGRMARFVEGVRNFAPDARWVKPGSLHITLKFIGEQPDEAVDPIKRALATIGSGVDQIRFQGYGFFPTAKSARVFWIGLESGPQLSVLARMIDEKMSSLGIEKETGAFSPHITLSRGAGRSGAAHRRKERRPKHNVPATAGEALGVRYAGFWYHDPPRVLSVSKPPLAERIHLH